MQVFDRVSKPITLVIFICLSFVLALFEFEKCISLKSVHNFVCSRTATTLPLPKETEGTRPRIDFVVFFIDLTNRLR